MLNKSINKFYFNDNFNYLQTFLRLFCGNKTKNIKLHFYFWLNKKNDNYNDEIKTFYDKKGPLYFLFINFSILFTK